MQPAHILLYKLRVLGFEFSIREGRLAVKPKPKITAGIRETITANREQILRHVECESWPPCEHDVLERAAILEFDGGHCRVDADRLALAEFGLSSWDELGSPNRGRATA